MNEESVKLKDAEVLHDGQTGEIIPANGHLRMTRVQWDRLLGRITRFFEEAGKKLAPGAKKGSSKYVSM